MKNFLKLLTISLALMLSFTFFACTERNNSSSDDIIDPVNYVSQLKLDLNSATAKTEATVKIYIDGDTTHFNVPESVVQGGVLKARYLAINTPESTGKVEPYGKVASDFTKSKLKEATSIILESDNSTWNADSTGTRYLVWIWYKTATSSEYRNLNLEILQNGLCIGNSTLNNIYGETCMSALNQAKAMKLNLYSGKEDPTFYYGEAIPMTLKELRLNMTDYLQKTVAVEGVITRFYNDGVYFEEYDEESDMYFGMYAYYSKSASARILDLMEIGNRVRLVGTVTEFQSSYQISGLIYDKYKPDSLGNCKLLSQGNEASYRVTTVEDYLGKKDITVYVPDEENPEQTVEKQLTFDYAELALYTTVTVNNLRITKTYATKSENQLSNGAVTITCDYNGKTITVRTMPFKDENKELIGKDYYTIGKTINVRGVIEYYVPEGQTNGTYQIKVYKLSDVIFN